MLCHREIYSQRVAFEREGKDALSIAHFLEYVQKRITITACDHFQDSCEVFFAIFFRNHKLVLHKSSFTISLVPVIDGIEGEKEFFIMDKVLGRILNKSDDAIQNSHRKAVEGERGKKKRHP